MSSTEKKLGYRVAQIQTLTFSFEDKSLEEVERIFEADHKNVGLNIKTAIDILREEAKIVFDLTTQLLEGKENSTVLVEHKARTVYEVEGMEGFYDPGTESFEFPDDFTTQLFALAYSHARALIAVEVSPTVYKGFYMLPVIDPTEFLENEKSS